MGKISKLKDITGTILVTANDNNTLEKRTRAKLKDILDQPDAMELMTPLFKFKNPQVFCILLNLLLGLNYLNAQIIYTDIVPDFNSTSVGDFYNLDLNNDGTIDFTFESINSTQLIWVESTNEVNAIRATGGPFEPYFLPLEENTVIAYPNEYYDSYGYLALKICEAYPSYCAYDWEGVTDKYLGLKILINGQTHYGWARLDVSSPTQWTIKDYAYQGTPNLTILAGEMSPLGVNDSNILTNLKILTSNNLITIFNLNETTQFTLFSITGKGVLKGSVSINNNIIDTSMISSGLYIIELKNPHTGITLKKKLII